MGGLRFLAGALLLAAMPSAFASKVSDCANADPNNYDDVYKCVSSYRSERDGRWLFEATISRSASECMALQVHYAAALRASGIKNANAAIPEKRALIPSCEMLAKVRDNMMGEPPSWAACMNYDPANVAEHMPGCLTNFLRGYKSKDKTFSEKDATRYLPHCQEALRVYERALKAAYVGARPPENYKKPDCNLVAGVLEGMAGPAGKITISLGNGQTAQLDENELRARAAEMLREQGLGSLADETQATSRYGDASRWSACLDYDPAKVTEHIKQCLAGKTIGLGNCQTMLALYESSVRAAYGGSFPQNYTRPTCADAQPVIDAAKIAHAQKREEFEAYQERIDERRRIAAAKQREIDNSVTVTDRIELYTKQALGIVMNALPSVFGDPLAGGQSGPLSWLRPLLSGMNLWGMIGSLFGAIAGAWFLWIGFKMGMKAGAKWLWRRLFSGRRQQRPVREAPHVDLQRDGW